MIDGVKITLVYHLYCRNLKDIEIETGNPYNEVNRRCLKYFNNIFDDAIFCICVDNIKDVELIQKAVEWIWSCGFGNNTTLKIKTNSPYRDASTFHDEVVECLKDFDGMVFFGHNKGNTYSFYKQQAQWVAYSYFSCLEQIKRNVRLLIDDGAACTYVPVISDGFKQFRGIRWVSPGTFMLINPLKLYSLSKEQSKLLFEDRFYAEMFLPSIIDIKDKNIGSSTHNIYFDGLKSIFFVTEKIDYCTVNHDELISYFLTPERVAEYQAFYNKIIDGLI